MASLSRQSIQPELVSAVRAGQDETFRPDRFALWLSVMMKQVKSI